MVYRHGDNKLRFSVSSNGSTLSTVTWASALSTGTWYFVAGEWDGTNIKLSLNGATFQTTSFAGPINSNTQPFDVGLISGSGNPLDGNIDEVGIWMGRALTQTEVGQLYNGGAGLPFGSFGNGGTPTPTPTATPHSNCYAHCNSNGYTNANCDCATTDADSKCDCPATDRYANCDCTQPQLRLLLQQRQLRPQRLRRQRLPPLVVDY